MHFTALISQRISPLFLLLICVLFSVVTRAQKPESPVNLDAEVTSLVLKKDIAAVADDLAAAKAGTVPELLRNLIIYARAGHRERVRQTLERLAETPDWRPY